MVRENLGHLVQPLAVLFFERGADHGMIETPAPLEQPGVDDLLRERVLEGIERHGHGVDEVESVQPLQVLDDPRLPVVEEPRHQGRRELTADDGGALDRLLQRLVDTVHAGGDDVVHRLRDGDVGAAEARLAVHDIDPTSLLQLTQDLLDVEGIALALGHQHVEQPGRDRLGAEERLGHAGRLPGVESRDGAQLHALASPGHREVRSRAEQEQHGMAEQRVDELAEELLGRGIDPVDVFHHEDERSAPTGVEEDVADQRLGAVLELGAETREQLGRRVDAQEVRHERHRFLVAEGEGAEPDPRRRPDVVVAGRLRQSEVAAQQSDDRVVGDRAAVAEAGGVELLVTALVQPVQELVEQPRLAHPRIADQHEDGAVALDRARIGRAERLHLVDAAEQRREAALARDLQARTTAQLARDRPAAHRLPLALDRELAEVLELEEPRGQAVRLRRADDLAGLGDVEHARRGSSCHRRRCSPCAGRGRWRRPRPGRC